MECNIIPFDDCVRLISQFVEEMNQTALYGTYERMLAENYASQNIMIKFVIYAYHEVIATSSRAIEKNCRRGINYMYLLGSWQVADHTTIV